ncbi:MAG: hypothetical protein JWQ14_2773 [Adhaeribacter sp.]|jgi:hypothetical protein|nr:hypothetical protein [Adhaeribacter sp.]
MEVIKFNTLLSDLKPRMQQVAVITGGYVTEAKSIQCQILEQCATSGGYDKLLFYVNEKDQLISFHFARKLDLRMSVCAIDYFPDRGKADLEKVAAIILNQIKCKV